MPRTTASGATRLGRPSTGAPTATSTELSTRPTTPSGNRISAKQLQEPPCPSQAVPPCSCSPCASPASSPAACGLARERHTLPTKRTLLRQPQPILQRRQRMQRHTILRGDLRRRTAERHQAREPH